MCLNPYLYDDVQEASTQADELGYQPVDDSVRRCENWVDVIAIDEASGKPVANLPYKVFDIKTDEEVASGITDGTDVPQSHCVDARNRELVVFFGNDDAIDKAKENIDEMKRLRALEAQANPDWHGIPAGLARDEFYDAYRVLIRARDYRLVSPSISFFEQSWYGWGSIFDTILKGSERADREFVDLNFRLCWEEYQLTTGAREATSGESFAGGIGQGLTFGFGEEFMSYLESVMDDTRSYEMILAQRRQIMEIERLSHQYWFIGGEIAGAIPTIFIPVGGAAAAGARGASTGTRAILRGAASASATGAILGAVDGFGHGQGSAINRFIKAGKGAVIGGVGALVLQGLGVLLARGLSRTTIVARIRFRPQWRAAAEEDIVGWIGRNIRTNPLRIAYEAEVRALSRYRAMVSPSTPVAELERIAQTASQARRSLGVKYKDLTPQPLRDFIHEVNIGRYGDELGPSFERAVQGSYAKLAKSYGREPTMQEVYRRVLDSVSNPNSNVDKLLDNFGKWLGGKADDYIVQHWKGLVARFRYWQDPSSIDTARNL